MRGATVVRAGELRSGVLDQCDGLVGVLLADEDVRVEPDTGGEDEGVTEALGLRHGSPDGQPGRSCIPLLEEEAGRGLVGRGEEAGHLLGP